MSLIYLVGRYGASAITLFAISLYTRLATPSDYGLFALVMALASAVYACLGQWLRQILLRFAIESAHGSDPLPSAIIRAFLLIALCVAVLAWLLSSQLAGDLKRALHLAFPLFVAMGLFELALAWLQLHLRSGLYVTLSFVRTSTTALLALGLLSLGYGADGLIAATFCGYAIAALPVFIITRLGIGRAQVSLAEWRVMVRFGWPTAVSASMGAALALADRALIAALLSTEAAGLYAAPYDLAMRTLQVLMLAINLAGTPLIYRAYEQGDDERTQFLLKRQWTLLCLASLPMALTMALIPEGIASLLLGSSFRAAGAMLMPLVAIGTFLQGLESFYLSFSFSLSKRPFRQMGILMAATVINIALTLIFVPIYGIIAGAWATLVSAAFALFGSFLAGRSLYRLPLDWPCTIRIIASLGPMAFFFWLVKPQAPLATLIAGSIGLGLYGISLLLFDVAGLRSHGLQVFRHRFISSRSAGGTS